MKNRIGMLSGCLLLVLVLGPSFALAQMDELKNTTPEERAQLQNKWMDSNLSLDAKTSATVADINLKYAKETQSLMDSGGPNLQKLMTFRKNSQAKDAELKAIFTPAQYTLYEQKKSETRRIWKPGRPLSCKK
jgi:hypothetical protein